MKSAVTLAMPKIFLVRTSPDRLNDPFFVFAAATDSVSLKESQQHG